MQGNSTDEPYSFDIACKDYNGLRVLAAVVWRIQGGGGHMVRTLHTYHENNVRVQKGQKVPVD